MFKRTQTVKADVCVISPSYGNLYPFGGNINIYNTRCICK